jgi:hypothetical protein
LAYFFSVKRDSEIIISLLLTGIIIQMTVVSFVNNWYRNKRPNLLDWFRLTTFLVLILNFLSIINDLTNQDNFNYYILKPEFILGSIFTILVGLFGLKISEIINTNLNLKSNKLYKVNDLKKYELRNPYLFYILAIILICIQIFLVLTGQIGYGTFQENTTSDFSFLFQIVFILASFFLSVLAIFRYIYSNKSSLLNLILFGFFTFQILYGFLSGMKENVILPIFIVLIPYLLSGRKLSRKYIFIGFVSLLLIYPLTNNYRDVLNNFPNIEKKQALGIAVVKTMELSITDNVSEGSDSFSNRLSLFSYLVYSIEKEPEWNYYKHLDRYKYLPVAWILPRFVMPDKPKSETGAILNKIIYGRETNSLTVTTYGWAYLEGGLIYVFLLFLLFGFFISYLEKKLKFDNYFDLLLYIGVLITLLKVEGDIYFRITGILQQILIYFIFYKTLIKRYL